MFVLYHALFFRLLPGILVWLLIKLVRRCDYIATFSERRAHPAVFGLWLLPV
jgi:hypothetical protein